MIEGPRPQARLPVVEIARRIDADDDIVVEPARIRVGRSDRRIAEYGQHPPRAGTEKALARHSGERVNDRRVAGYRRPEPQILGKPAATRLHPPCSLAGVLHKPASDGAERAVVDVEQVA